MDLSKLIIKPSSQFFDALNDCIGKIQLISSLPIHPSDYDENDKGACETIIDSITFQPCHEVQGMLNIKKTSEICEEICETLEKLKVELMEKGTFETLINYVDKSCEKYMNELSLIEEYSHNNEVLESLEQNLKQLQKNQSEKSHDVDNRHFQAILQFYQNQNEVNNDENFSRKWIESQVKQNDLRILKKEAKILESFKLFNFMTYRESYSGDASEKFYEYKIKELTEETERMSIEYEKLLEEVELKYQILKNERRRFDEMAETERNVFEFRQKKIDDYLAIKAKKAADEKLRELQEAKSITIQAWWRGVMVRCYLGSFKKFKKRARKVRQEMKNAKTQKGKSKKK